MAGVSYTRDKGSYWKSSCNTKVKDAQEVYMSYLKAEKAAGRGDRLTLRDLSRVEAEYKKRLLDFSCRAPTCDGNPSKVFDWCGELEKHLSRFECETILNDAIKRCC